MCKCCRESIFLGTNSEHDNIIITAIFKVKTGISPFLFVLLWFIKHVSICLLLLGICCFENCLFICLCTFYLDDFCSKNSECKFCTYSCTKTPYNNIPRWPRDRKALKRNKRWKSSIIWGCHWNTAQVSSDF